jgi:hypothetical protein
MIPVDPYKRSPVPPMVATLVDGIALDENGTYRSFDRWPDGLRCWVDYDECVRLLRAGEGEAVCWNGEPIRWRHKRFEQGWQRRRSDVHVLRVPFDPDPKRNLRSLAAWRDWLARYGAAPTSTTGGAAWSLLRATLEDRLWLSGGAVPPLLQTLGGRQELGPAGQGRFVGRLVHLDLEAAYASELGGLPYGGKWIEADGTFEPEEWAAEGRPVFCRARVRIPEMNTGPLPRRPRRRVYGLDAVWFGPTYPTGTTLQGVWSWQELEAARLAGCRIRILDTWVHLASGRRPFAPWWEAIQDGRRMPGLAGLLAKVTGNALWGQFCMDSRNNGTRTIRGRGAGTTLVERPHPMRGGRPPAHDLAETISGRVRARLFTLMNVTGDDLLSAHTDGAWIQGGEWVDDLTVDLESEDGGAAWRLKHSASRLDLLDPQVLRYWPRRSRPVTVYAGRTRDEADDAFDARWNETFPQEEATA